MDYLQMTAFIIGVTGFAASLIEIYNFLSGTDFTITLTIKKMAINPNCWKSCKNLDIATISAIPPHRPILNVDYITSVEEAPEFLSC